MCNSQKGEFIFLLIFRLCTIQLHVCLTALVLEDNILLVTLVHVLSLTMNRVICRQTFEGNKLIFVYALTKSS